VEGRLHELDNEFREGERAFLLLEQVHQAFPPIFERRVVTMLGQFLLNLFSSSLLFRDGQLQKLNVVRH
jgi:hypothetical protein